MKRGKEGEAFINNFFGVIFHGWWLYLLLAVGFVLFLIFCAVTGWRP